jgi:hypothetical protein
VNFLFYNFSNPSRRRTYSTIIASIELLHYCCFEPDSTRSIDQTSSTTHRGITLKTRKFAVDASIPSDSAKDIQPLWDASRLPKLLLTSRQRRRVYYCPCQGRVRWRSPGTMDIVTCRCLKCKAELGRFRNSWNGIGNTYFSPVHAPVSFDGFESTGDVYEAAQGSQIEDRYECPRDHSFNLFAS